MLTQDQLQQLKNQANFNSVLLAAVALTMLVPLWFATYSAFAFFGWSFITLLVTGATYQYGQYCLDSNAEYFEHLNTL